MFASNRSGGLIQLHLLDLAGGGETVQLLEIREATVPVSWSPDGDTLFYYFVDEEGDRDIHGYSFRDGTTRPLLATPADERAPVVSPDGRWLAYLSDESGRPEVYVSAFPGLDVRRQVSRGGAVEPLWSRDGDELYYRSSDLKVVAVPFGATPTLELGPPQALFDDTFQRANFLNPLYAVGPDGRFLMVSGGEQAATGVRLQVVLGFADEVHRLVSAQQ